MIKNYNNEKSLAGVLLYYTAFFNYCLCLIVNWTLQDTCKPFIVSSSLLFSYCILRVRAVGAAALHEREKCCRSFIISLHCPQSKNRGSKYSNMSNTSGSRQRSVD